MYHHWIILLCACLLEATFGYPRWLYARIWHPVVWMGACITVLDRNFNHPQITEQKRRAFGVLAMLILLGITLAVTSFIQWIGLLAELLAIAALLASSSLYDHVYEVYLDLEADNLESAREKVSRIVGRDVANLDAGGVCRAAIESLAESFCDGVVAPFFWAACFGLPGIACYKAINTADSMIGHKDERYKAFGWATARLDDFANLIPARLSGTLIAVVSGSRNAWRIMWRDAGKHASPNAGWPEAAMAGALGLRVGGTNSYDGVLHESPFIGEGAEVAITAHLYKALQLYIMSCITLLVVWLILVQLT